MINRKKVLILCTANSARSQMAEGLLRAIGGDRFEVFSAGTIKSHVRPQAVVVMQEVGIDITTHHSKSLDVYAGKDFDYVITVCDSANESCPVFPGIPKRIHWSVADPAAASGDEEVQLAAFREARDELTKRLQIFVDTEK